jgi:hypothetical protein
MLYLPGLKNVVANFFYPALPSLETPGTVAVAAAADPVDFETMATEQNHCVDMQILLGGSSLKIVFRQAGAQRLDGDVSAGVFHPIVSAKFRKKRFFAFAQHFPPWETCLPPSYVF